MTTTTTHPQLCLSCGGLWKHNKGCDDPPTPEQPAPDAGEWRYVQTKYAAEVVAGKITIKPHWLGLGDSEEIRAVMRQVVSDHAVAGRIRRVDANRITEIKQRR